MIRSLLSFFVLTSLLILTINQALAADLVRNGSAIYNHLTRDYYSAALYLPQATQSADTIRSSDNFKRMRLVVLTRWTPRKWQEQWQSNIAINNQELPQNQQQRQALMAFIRLPQGNLEAGDEIRIDASAQGSWVYLNNELAIETNDQTLFRYLFNTWVGKFPPSREFRDQILGNKLNPSAQQQIENHSLPPARVGLFSRWNQQLEQQRLAQQQRIKEQRLAEQNRLKEQQRLAEQDRAKEQQRLKKIQQEKAAARLAEQQAAARLAEQQAAEKARQQTELQQQQAQLQLQLQRQRQLQKQKQQEKQRRQELAEQQAYYQKLYHWQLQQALNNEVRYPPWARQFDQEGHIQLVLTFNQDGEIIGLQNATPDQPELLSEEVQRAAQVISAQVKPPADLNDTSWQFTLSYLFLLNGNNLTPVAKPQRPSSLKPLTSTEPEETAEIKEETEASIKIGTGTEQTAQPSSYQQRVRTAVIDNLVYPKTAKVLKKQGEVVIEIQLDGSGEIITLKNQQLSRHRELNRALRQAIEDAAPFGPTPDGQSLNILLNYQFRL
ncbi:TonB family protein [Bacterioplanoides sp.]|uniref:TonB family protein n=1 Tax=Bacterioplanoides sp. TaxID=2066072 RepID=UPI003B009D7A